MFVIDQIIKEKGLKFKSEKLEVKKYDEKGNLTYYKDSDGFEQRWKYDEKGNSTYYKDSDGFERWCEFNTQGEITKRLELKKGIYYLNGEQQVNR